MAGLPDRQYFGMGGRVVEFASTVALAGEDKPVLDDHRAHRHLSTCKSRLGLGEGDIP